MIPFIPAISHQMRKILFFINLLFGLFLYEANAQVTLSLEEAVNLCALQTPKARAEYLRYTNYLLEFENYQKGFLPSIQLSFNPLNFNRSMRLLQNSYDGDYSNVEDYSNTSSMDLSVSQSIGLTGGELSASSSLGFLREFSRNNNSYSTTPIYIGYSQPLWGGKQQYKFERMLQHLQRDIAVKSYCTSVSSVQQEVLSLYLTTYLYNLEIDLAQKNMQTGDTLMQLATIKRADGYITDYDYNEIELQQLENQYAHARALQNYEEALCKLMSKLDRTEPFILMQPDGKALPVLLDESVVIGYIHQNNPQTLLQEQQRVQAAYIQYQARLATLFNGTVSLNYGSNQYAETLKEAYKHPNSRQAISIGFSIPAFQWGINRNKRRIAENEYEATILDLQANQQNFEEQVKTQISSYNYTVNLYNLAESRYSLAQDQYRLAVEKFALGKASIYELTSANERQYSLMKEYYLAIKSLFTGYYALRHLALYDFVQDKRLEDLFMK